MTLRIHAVLAPFGPATALELTDAQVEELGGGKRAAVVVGIRRDPDADADATRWITNLNGPDNDALAVAEWLRSPGGGGLPQDNVRVVCSRDFPDPFPGPDKVGPQQRAVEDARDGGGVHEDAVRQRGSQLQTHARGGVDGDGDGEGPSGFDDGEVRDGRAARKQLDFGRREHGLWE